MKQINTKSFYSYVASRAYTLHLISEVEVKQIIISFSYKNTF